MGRLPGTREVNRSPQARRVLFVQYTNPGGYPPLLHAAELLTATGCAVAFCGLDSNGAMRVPPGIGATVTSLRPAASAWLVPLHSLWFLARVVWLAARWRPDWVYASDPKACPAAWCLRRLLGCRVVYHEHDSPAPETESRSVAARLVAAARRGVGREADVCVLPSEPRARAFGTLVGRTDVVTVWNTPLRREIGAPPPPREGLRVVYHGSLVPARLPLAAIDALSSLPDDVTLTAIGYETAGHPGYGRQLLQRARDLGLAHRVTVQPAVARDALMAGCAAYDAGLALLPVTSSDLNEQSMAGASNKVFDYLAAGLPVLVPEDDGWREMVVAPGYGLACRAESVDAIARSLAWLRDHPADRARMGRLGQERIRRDWNYETSFAPVLDRLSPPAAEAA